MKKKLSPTMQQALDTIKEHGKIVRYPGGFFAPPKTVMRIDSYTGAEVPKDSFGVATMEALHKRGLIILMNFHFTFGKLVPTEYALKPDNETPQLYP